MNYRSTNVTRHPTYGLQYTVGKVGTFTALVRIWGWFVAKRAMAESLVADAGEAV